MKKKFLSSFKAVEIILFWIFSLSFSLFFSLLFFSNSSFAKIYEVQSFDSIAGYGTEINISGGNENEKVSILLRDPHSKRIETFSLQLKNSGDASFLIPAEKTQKAGKYTFVVVKKNQFYSDGIEHFFEIFADDADMRKSQLFALSSKSKTGKKAKITAVLYDRFQNPIAGHRLKLYSSRDNDRIIALSDSTNSNGEIDFFVTSNSSGESKFVLEDETSGGVFSDSPQIRFYKPLNDENNFSADITNSKTEYANVARFEIDFPTTVTADSDANYLTVRALDSDGVLVKNFTGTVKIMIPTDKNAVVPGEDGIYSFLEKDQGEILFSRSVVFPEKGKHSLEVYAYDKVLDKINYNIFAKQTITVEEKKQNTNNKNIITLVTPSNKSLFSSSDIPVRGTALAYSDVKISLDGNAILEVAVDGEGKYTALLKNVSEGNHVLSVFQKEDPSVSSEEVTFIIDTKASNIISASFSPHVVKPLEKVMVTVQVEDEKDVKTLQVFWNGKSEKAKLIGNNQYQLSFTAPSEEGEYPIKVTAIDKLQNSTNKNLTPDLIVKKELKSLGDIKNLTAKYNNKTKILTLSWTKLPKNPLLYVVQSGISKEKLNKVKSVSGKTSTAKLENLAAGKYFFMITSIQNNGKDGAKSQIIEYEIIIPTPTPTSTPSTPTPTPTSKISTPTPIPKPQLFLSPRNATLQPSWKKGIPLFWEKYPKAKNYRLSYGLASRSYGAEIEVPSYLSSKTIIDLIPGVRYFILLEALGENGNVIFSYKELTAIPLDGEFHPAPKEKPLPYPKWIAQTGPQLFLFLGGLFLFFSAWYLTRKEEEIS